jgi:hypothetical protein
MTLIGLQYWSRQWLLLPVLVKVIAVPECSIMMPKSVDLKMENDTGSKAVRTVSASSVSLVL